MLRFPNPSSTIENFVSVYSSAFQRLNGLCVDLDNIVQAVNEANLVTSCGYMGDEAVARSTRADRSLDPIFNQLKMYAELFRTLGWLHRTPEHALKFQFTLLGEQVVAAGRNFRPLLEESVLGVVYPTPILAVQGQFDLRPFAFILRAAVANDDYLSRDEMIIGPLCAPSDRQDTSLDATTQKIQEARLSLKKSRELIAEISNSRGIQVNTLRNYTRWPIGILRDLGWANLGTAQFRDGKKYDCFFLTERGKAVARRITDSIDLRVDDVQSFPRDQRIALAVLAHFRMLERSGFDISPVESRLVKAELDSMPVLKRFGTDGTNLLFSPFQSLSLEDISLAFPSTVPVGRSSASPRAQLVGEVPEGRDDRSHLFVESKIVEANPSELKGPEHLRGELAALLLAHESLESAAKRFAENHATDTQATFYPLVTHLFQILGFKSDYSRPGVNYQRWDACVWVGDFALPVEIKSPTEEPELSTKAIRQALENKVVLIARGGLEIRREFASLVVGNRIPNERGEMSTLIDDVFNTYKMRLGVIDLTTLGHLALRSVRDDVTIDAAQLSELKGFLNV